MPKARFANIKYIITVELRGVDDGLFEDGYEFVSYKEGMNHGKAEVMIRNSLHNIYIINLIATDFVALFLSFVSFSCMYIIH